MKPLDLPVNLGLTKEDLTLTGSSIPFQKKRLSEVSTFKIGGECLFFVEVRTRALLKEVFQFIQIKKCPFYILGKGSNTVFDDRGFSGVVISNKMDNLEILRDEVRVEGGYSFSLLGTKMSRGHLAGLEFASGIPGSVGGAIFMNAGAGGQETKDCLVSVDYMTFSLECKTYQKEELEFGYRYCSLQKERGMILGATFKLQSSPLAKEKQRRLMDYRLNTQPYKDPSVGCIFRNPEGGSAGALIEKCHLKGVRVGGAEVSTLHANFIVNREGATQKEVLELSQIVESQVFKESGIKLEREARFIDWEGCDL